MAISGRSRPGLINVPIGGGIVVDDVPHEVTENICTDGLNVRFRDGFVRKTEGYSSALTTPSAAALHIATLQNQGNNFWVHATSNALFSDDGTTKTDITGTALTTGSGNKFTSCVLGGVLVINNQADVPQYWGGTGTAAALTAWDSNWRCASLRSFKNYLVAVNITKSGTNYASMVKWSHAAAPGFLPDSWDEADVTRDAGEVDVAETDDQLVDALPLGNTMVLYKERSAYGMQYIGNNDIFKFFRLHGNPGILSQNCVANTPKGHVVLTGAPDVVVHYANEPRSVLKGRWKDWLRENIDPTNYRAAFVFDNRPKDEAWICIPTSGNTYCNRALVWNYEEDTLTLVAIPSLTHATVGRYLEASGVIDNADYTYDSASADVFFDTFDVSERALASSGSSKIYLVDEGDTYDGSAIAATFTRSGLHFGDPDQVKTLKGAVLRVDADAGTVLTVEFGYSNDAEGPYTYATGVTYTVGTSRRADAIVSGRFLAMRVSSASTGQWRIKSVGYELAQAGAY